MHRTDSMILTLIINTIKSGFLLRWVLQLRLINNVNLTSAVHSVPPWQSAWDILISLFPFWGFLCEDQYAIAPSNLIWLAFYWVQSKCMFDSIMRCDFQPTSVLQVLWTLCLLCKGSIPWVITGLMSYQIHFQAEYSGLYPWPVSANSPQRSGYRIRLVFYSNQTTKWRLRV